MTGLSEDIIVEILSRLPVKSLIRFRCVCKRWLSLINDPKFAKLHLSRATNKKNYFDYRRLLICIYTNNREADTGGADAAPPSVCGQVVGYCKGFVCLTWESNTSDYTMVSDDVIVDAGFFLFHRRLRFRVLGSCNGLICMISGSNTFHFLNPSTKEEKTFLYTGEVNGGPYLLHGFGYDSSTDDYKLVLGNHTKSITEVLSLKTNCWRTIQEYPSYKCVRNSNVIVNEALHWIGGNSSRGYGPFWFAVIVSFDLRKEKFMELPLPGDEMHFVCFLTLGALGGDLALIQRHSDGSHQVWAMKDYGVQNSWTKLIKLPPSRMTRVVPFDYARNGDIVLLVDDNKLTTYNSQGEAQENNDLVVPQNSYCYMAYLYLETLISPNICH